MQKRSMLIRAANWQSPFLNQFRCFQNRNLGCNFQILFTRKRGFVHPYFYMKMNHLDIVFHMTRKEWKHFQSWRSGFPKGSAFSQVQGPQSGSGSGFQNDAHHLFFLCLFRKADQISELKELNRSKVISHFLEQPIYKRKSEYDFGNSIGDKNTRSSEMKSKFRFSKAKKKGKSTKFRGKLIILPHKNSWKVWGKLKSGMRILWNL